MIGNRSELEDKVQEALMADRRTEDLVVQLTNNNGVITLAGRAPSDEARRAAGEIAKNVPGVAEVINDLSLEEDEVDSALPSIMAGDEEQTGVSSSLP